MKVLIVNADDFGYSHGINRGVLEAHDRGVLTSASLMVNTAASLEAVRMARDAPRVSIGLHANFTNESEQLIDTEDPHACRDELERQFDWFVERTGRLPTHLDSHQHVHRSPRPLEVFRAFAEQHRIPLRDFGPVLYVGGFYAQWELGVSDPAHVSLEALSAILRNEVPEGVTELGCHPGYRDPSFRSIYDEDRERELATLCDPRVREVLCEERIDLISYLEVPDALRALGRSARSG